MGIKWIANDAARDAAEIRDSLSTIVDKNKRMLVKGGPRHLSYKSNVAGPIDFINKDGTMSGDHIVVVRADRFDDASDCIVLTDYSTYNTSNTTILDTGPSPTLVGLNSQDYVGSFTAVTSSEAFGVSTFNASAPHWMNAVYIGTAVDMGALAEDRPVVVRPWDDQEDVIHGPWHYKIHEQAELRFEDVSDEELESFSNLYRLDEMPVFAYDSTGTYLPGKLWHCLVTNYTSRKVLNDSHDVTVEMLRLKEYPDYA